MRGWTRWGSADFDGGVASGGEPSLEDRARRGEWGTVVAGGEVFGEVLFVLFHFGVFGEFLFGDVDEEEAFGDFLGLGGFAGVEFAGFGENDVLVG